MLKRSAARTQTLPSVHRVEPVVRSCAAAGSTALRGLACAGSTTADGFVAEYWCVDPATVTLGCTASAAANFDPQATADDGSCVTACGANQPMPLQADATGRHLALNFTGGYENRMDCSWRVECGTDGTGGGRETALLLQFTAFDTRSRHDFVSLTDSSGGPISIGDGLSGSAVPSQTFGSLSGTLAVHFTSDGARRLLPALPCRRLTSVIWGRWLVDRV